MVGSEGFRLFRRRKSCLPRPRWRRLRAGWRTGTFGLGLWRILHLDCVVPSGLLSKISNKVLSLERQGFVPAGDRLWVTKPGSSVHVFKKWMRKRSWNVVRPWVWQSDLVASYQIDLSVRSRQSRSTTLHNFRQNWRLHQLRVFLRGDRHKAQEMLRHRSEQELLDLANDVNFEELRALILQSAPFRTVLLGAFVSSGWMSMIQGTDPRFHHCPMWATSGGFRSRSLSLPGSWQFA